MPGRSVLDVLLFAGGDGRRLVDLILGTRVISARMAGPTNDLWQFASPAGAHSQKSTLDAFHGKVASALTFSRRECVLQT